MTSALSHWSSDLVKGMCEDVGALAWVALCPCIVFARNAKNITDGDASFFRTCMTYAAVGGCWGTLACYVCGPLGYWITCVPCYASSYRKQLRAKRGLSDVPLSDKEAHFFCHPCALSQEFREIKSWHSDIVIGPDKPTIDRPPEETITYLKSMEKMMSFVCKGGINDILEVGKKEADPTALMSFDYPMHGDLEAKFCLDVFGVLYNFWQGCWIDKVPPSNVLVCGISHGIMLCTS